MLRWNQIKELKEENIKLHRKNNELMDEKKDIHQIIIGKDTELEWTIAGVGLLRIKYDKLKETNQTLAQWLNELKIQNEKQNAENLELEIANDKLTQEFNKLELKYKETKQELSKSKQELIDTSIKLDEYENPVCGWYSDYDIGIADYADCDTGIYTSTTTATITDDLITGKKIVEQTANKAIVISAEWEVTEWFTNKECGKWYNYYIKREDPIDIDTKNIFWKKNN